MDEAKELSHVFMKDMKIGDKLIVLGSEVQIDKIELVIRTKIIDGSKPKRNHITVHIPMTDFENPFPHKGT